MLGVAAVHGRTDDKTAAQKLAAYFLNGAGKAADNAPGPADGAQERKPAGFDPREYQRSLVPDHPALKELSMADEISPEVADENSPLRCGLVASVSAWRHDVSEVCEVEIDDGLQGFAGRGLAEGVRQGVGPGGVIGL